MKRHLLFAAALLLAATTTTAIAADPQSFFKPTESRSAGSVNGVSYDAIAGTLVVHGQGYDDAATKDDLKNGDLPPEASMFYAAYFKHGADAAKRPIVFIFNGGPGSATVWLHMGAFGPRRVVTNDDSHTPAAPYSVIDNPQSLLDVADLVFIDEPGAGFSRIAGKNSDKAFYGIDADAHAFTEFVAQFLGKYNRWNSPKYLFGESYGTMRAANMAAMLQGDKAIDLNGVILLSQVFNWDIFPDEPELNPGLDLPYQLVLPSYAATAWYHHKLPPANQSKPLRSLVQEVERFAMGEYARALSYGYSLDDKTRAHIADKLSQYTGLPVSYILKSNLRINYGPFQQQLLGSEGMVTGSLDTRFAGIALDPLAKSVDYDPQGSAISSAYIAAFNQYTRDTLHYGAGTEYKMSAPIRNWDWAHKPPGAYSSIKTLPNVMPDMATAMKQNPNLKVMLNGGYYDVVTPYYEGWYEMHHLQIPKNLAGNIEYHYYESGHMVYAHVPALQQLHDNVAAFIRKTSGGN